MFSRKSNARKKFCKSGVPKEKSCIFAASNSENVPVAQLVEQLTLNQWVQGSNPCGDTK